MTTKMKGLLKGLRYISHIFEEDKDQEIQIGFPTDVRHVAHIGWDGPSAPAAVDSSPSWMKEFKSPTGFQSAPLDSNGNTIEDPQVNWVSQDSTKSNRATDSIEIPRSSRRHHNNNNNNNNNSPRKKDSSIKSRQSRRNHSRDSSEGSVKSSPGGENDESSQPSDSPSRAHPDIARKSRRKKSKELDGDGSTRSSRSKDSDGGSNRRRSKDLEGSGSSRSRSKLAPCGSSACSDPSADSGSVLRMYGSPLGSISSMHDKD